MEFKGKRVLLTGASGGIGIAVAKAFTEAGAVLAVADLSVDGIAAQAYLPGDLSDDDYVNGLVPHAIEALGGIETG